MLKTLAALGLAGAVMLPAVAHAGPGGPGGKRLDKLCEKIECTDSQKTEIREVFKQMRTDVKPDREALRNLKKQAADEWVKDRPDDKKLERIREQMHAHHANIADRRAEAMSEIHPLLRPEQRKKMAEAMERRGKKKGKKKGKKAKKRDDASR